MSNQWEQIGGVAPGGTVFVLATDARGRCWLGTDAGLFFQHEANWLALSQGQPLQYLSALTCAGQTIFAGNGQGQIVYSSDGGQTWYQGSIGQTHHPISWLVASPNFEQDRVLLAGTNGDGILRSTDGGRNWHLSNFGLHDFSVIALAVAPVWRRREYVFAATLDGFYRSPNGGRAWKKADAGLEGVEVQTIVVSPHFAEDKTLFVGTETGVFRSVDQGKSWQLVSEGLAVDGALPSVNCLWLHPDFATTPLILAGTAEGQIFRSTTGGTAWQAVADSVPVLCFDRVGDCLYAGLHEQGLLISLDEGVTWSADTGLTARSLTRLLINREQIFAYGYWESLWRSADGGATWGQIAELADYQPLFSLTASPQGDLLLLSTGSGLLRSADGGKRWQAVLEVQPEEVVAACFSPDFATDQQIWLGTTLGRLLTSVDGGLTWTSLETPQPGSPLLQVAILPASAALGKGKTSHILTAATFSHHNDKVLLWHTPRQEMRWTQWMQATGKWPSVYLSLVGEPPERVAACIDRRGWRTSAAGWERVLETSRSIGRLQSVGGHGLLVLTGQNIMRSDDGGATWADFDEGLADYALQDVALSADGQTAYLLSTGGVMWRREMG